MTAALAMSVVLVWASFTGAAASNEHETDASARPGPDAMHLWSRSCALGHVDGNAGAPRVGHPEEWQPRLAQGMDVLLDHTVNGFNKMPPLGYCMACEAEDFRALIDFMAGTAE
jgi:cytochrome c5